MFCYVLTWLSFSDVSNETFLLFLLLLHLRIILTISYISIAHDTATHAPIIAISSMAGKYILPFTSNVVLLFIVR